MNSYIEIIEKHTVHTNLTNVLHELTAIEVLKDKPPADVDALARITMVIKNFSLALDSCDKNLIAIQWLEEASKALANIKSYLVNYKSYKDPNYLTNHCFTQLEIILHCSVKFNCVKSKQTMRGVTDATKEYIKYITSHYEQINGKIASLEERITSHQKDISRQETVLQDQALDFHNTLAKEQQRLDNFATSYQKQMTEDQKSFSSMTDSFKKAFDNMQSEHKLAVDIELKKISTQETEHSQLFLQQTDHMNQIYEDTVAVYTDKLDKYMAQVKQIVGIIDTNVFSHKYKKVADDARKRAKLWHIITLLITLAVSVFSIYAFVITVNIDTNWVTLVAKIFATTTLITGAAYAARQATKQEKVERYARKIEMELVAIDPFIESLDEEKRSAVKEELSRKIFGNPNALELSSTDSESFAIKKLSSIEDLLKCMTTLIKKL